MKEKLSREEVLKLMGDYAHELPIIEKMVGDRSSVSLVTPCDTTIWVTRKGATFTYERHLP